MSEWRGVMLVCEGDMQRGRAWWRADGREWHILGGGEVGGWVGGW